MEQRDLYFHSPRTQKLYRRVMQPGGGVYESVDWLHKGDFVLLGKVERKLLRETWEVFLQIGKNVEYFVLVRDIEPQLNNLCCEWRNALVNADLNGQNEALRKIEERLRIHVRPRLQLRVAR